MNSRDASGKGLLWRCMHPIYVAIAKLSIATVWQVIFVKSQIKAPELIFVAATQSTSVRCCANVKQMM